MNQKKYLILGLGMTGLSCAKFLAHQGIDFSLFDTREEFDVSKLVSSYPSTAIYLGDWQAIDLHQFTELLISPGISLAHPLIKKAKGLNLTVLGDIQLFAEYNQNPSFAVTGTNGKSTVVTLVGEMAKHAGIDIAIGGNIGTPVLDLLSNSTHVLWGLELSSFQLETVSNLNLCVSAILNISDDHMDRYENFDQYIAAKQRIHANSTAQIYNRQDANTYPKNSTNIISVGLDLPTAPHEWGLTNKDNQCWIAKGQECLLPVNQIKIKGKHNIFNAMVAAAIAEQLTIDRQSVIEVLLSFKGLAHRCQWVGLTNGVEWINDSKGTNVGATVSAINGIGNDLLGKIILIAGGQGKDADFSPLKKPIEDYVSTVVAIGQDGHKIADIIADSSSVTLASSMENAVSIAHQVAKKGDIVLLSPACASFDMFSSFEHRGDVFIDCVTRLV